jgi:hypothetical protein
MKITRLRVKLARPRMPRFHPMAKRLFIVLKEGGQKSLWIRQVATTSNIQIVAPSEANMVEKPSRPMAITFTTSIPTRTIHRVPCSRLAGVRRSSEKNSIQYSERYCSFRDTKPASLSFAMTMLHTGEDQLIVANADGSNESKLAARKGDAFFSTGGLSWSPDGKLIACPAGAYAGGFPPYGRHG